MVDIQNIPEFWKNRYVKYALIFIGACLVIYLWIASWQNKIYLTETKMNQFWAILKENTERRIDIIPQFVELIHEAPGAQPAAESLRAGYVQAKQIKSSEQILSSEQDVQIFSHVQQQVTDAFSTLRKQSQSSALGQNNRYVMLDTYVRSLEQQIDYSARALEQQIIYYNFQISTFPQNLINFIYRYPKKYPIKIQMSNGQKT